MCVRYLLIKKDTQLPHRQSLKPNTLTPFERMQSRLRNTAQSYAVATDEFFQRGGTVTQCPSPQIPSCDEDWHLLRDALEPYKPPSSDASRWTLGYMITDAIRESLNADMPIDGENE